MVVFRWPHCKPERVSPWSPGAGHPETGVPGAEEVGRTAPRLLVAREVALQASLCSLLLVCK